LQGEVEIVDAKEQEETVAGGREIRAQQGEVLVGGPGVQAEQDRSVRVEDLAEVPVVPGPSPAGRRGTGTNGSSTGRRSPRGSSKCASCQSSGVQRLPTANQAMPR
jgi:hypothetical protein